MLLESNYLLKRHLNIEKNIIEISEVVASKIIEDLSGDKLNESSIKAAVSEISKNNLEKNLW